MKVKQEVSFLTKDNVQIAGMLTKNNQKTDTNVCIIVVPGFAQHSGTKTMSDLCASLAKFGDVLCIDLRGTGKSKGGYFFGGKEYLDVEAAVEWAVLQYSHVCLFGLSLGAYSALRAAVSFDYKIQHLFLVSCPTSVDEIVWSGAALRHLFNQVFKKPGSLTKERNLLFKWRNPFCIKPSAEEFASQVRMPVSFLVGAKDLLTPKSMSYRVFDKIQTANKIYLEIPEGAHAEELFFPFSSELENWILAGINFKDKDATTPIDPAVALVIA